MDEIVCHITTCISVVPLIRSSLNIITKSWFSNIIPKYLTEISRQERRLNTLSVDQ